MPGNVGFQPFAYPTRIDSILKPGEAPDEHAVARLMERDQQLEDTLQALGPDAGWTNLAIQSGSWTATVQPAVRKVGLIVYMQGEITSPVVGDYSSIAVIFTLPAQYAPPVFTKFPIANGGTTGLMYVRTDGTISVQGLGSVAPVQNTVTTLAASWVGTI